MSSTDLSDMLKGVAAQPPTTSARRKNKSGAIPPLAATYLNRSGDSRHGSAKPGKVTQYSRLVFVSSARNDGLTLRHWRRSKTAKGADYEFAKFNHTTRMVVYTDVEWKALQLDKSEPATKDVSKWSREETDYLLSLCHQFGLRWPVIADRYSFSNKLPAKLKSKSKSKSKTSSSSSSSSTTSPSSASTVRNVLDLKHRYYYVARSVLSHRYNRDIKTGPAPARVELCAPYSVSVLQPGPVEAKLLMAFQYDIQEEEKRTNFLLKVFNKTPDQEDEEAALKLELKRIELQMKKISDNKDLMIASAKHAASNVLRGHGPVSAAPTNTGASTARNTTTIVKNKKNSKLRNEILHPARMGPLTTDAPVYLRSVRLLSEATPAALRHQQSRRSALSPPVAATTAPSTTTAATTTATMTATNQKMSKKAIAAATAAAAAASASASAAESAQATAALAFQASRRSSETNSEAATAVSNVSVGPKMLMKMRMVLHELGVPSRPIPTRKICDVYDEIRRDVLTILTAKKRVLPQHRSKALDKHAKREQSIQQELAEKNVPNANDHGNGGTLFRDRVAMKSSASSGRMAKVGSRKRSAPIGTDGKPVKRTRGPKMTSAQRKAAATQRKLDKAEKAAEAKRLKAAKKGAKAGAKGGAKGKKDPKKCGSKKGSAKQSTGTIAADIISSSVSEEGTKKRGFAAMDEDATEGADGGPSNKRIKVEVPAATVTNTAGIDLSNIEPIPLE